MQFFTFGQGDFHLDPGVFEVDGKGNQRIARLLHLGREHIDLLLVHQKALGPQRIPVGKAALLIGRDVHLLEIQLTVLNGAPGLFETQLSGADGLDLSAKQLNTGLKLFHNIIFVIGLWILGHQLDAAFLCHRLSLLCTVDYSTDFPNVQAGEGEEKHRASGES